MATTVNPTGPKPAPNVYTVMLIVSFVALVVASLLLAMELGRFGPGVPWNVSGGS
jgi:hypothetical protein